jgi:hypothetical protein
LQLSLDHGAPMLTVVSAIVRTNDLEALRTGASGLRSSCASTFKNSLLVVLRCAAVSRELAALERGQYERWCR